jgi:hypothetical protein
MCGAIEFIEGRHLHTSHPTAITPATVNEVSDDVSALGICCGLKKKYGFTQDHHRDQ